MFMESSSPIDLGEPIYGRKTIGCAPKGANKFTWSCLFYKHFTATRFSDRLLKGLLKLLSFITRRKRLGYGKSHLGCGTTSSEMNVGTLGSYSIISENRTGDSS